MTKEEQIKFLQDNVAYLFSVFHVFKLLRPDYMDSLGPDLGKIIVSSLSRNYLLGLASLAEPKIDQRGNENLSIHIIEGIDISKYDPIIKKLRRYRRKLLAHNDKEAMHKGDSYFEKDSLTLEESEGLLDFFIKSIEGASGGNFPREEMAEKYTKALKDALRQK